MDLILLLEGRGFFRFEFEKKILGGWGASFSCFAGVFEGGFWKIVFF